MSDPVTRYQVPGIVFPAKRTAVFPHNHTALVSCVVHLRKERTRNERHSTKRINTGPHKNPRFHIGSQLS